MALQLGVYEVVYASRNGDREERVHDLLVSLSHPDVRMYLDRVRERAPRGVRVEYEGCERVGTLALEDDEFRKLRGGRSHVVERGASGEPTKIEKYGLELHFV